MPKVKGDENKNSVAEVEKISDKRVKNIRVEYLVHWKDSSQPEWVKAENCDCPIAIADYLKSIGEWKEEYEVEGIIDSIKHGRKVEYLVKWENYPVNDCSWVKEKDMHCDDILKKFKRGKKYKHEELREVKRIRKSRMHEGKEYFRVEWEDDDGDEDKDYHDIEEIYIMPNGRKAIEDFHKRAK